MNASEVMDVNMRTAQKKGKAKMVSMEYKPSENGGHVFTHRMEGEDGRYHDPETHSFGKSEGKQALAHFAKYAGISEGLPKSDKDSAAGAAT